MTEAPTVGGIKALGVFPELLLELEGAQLGFNNDFRGREMDISVDYTIAPIADLLSEGRNNFVAIRGLGDRGDVVLVISRTNLIEPGQHQEYIIGDRILLLGIGLKLVDQGHD